MSDRTIKKYWIKLSHIGWLVRLFHFLQVAAPFAVTAWAVVTAFSDQLPKSAVIALATITLAGAVLFVNQLRMLFSIPVVVAAKNDIRFGMSYDSVIIAFNPDPIVGGLQIGLLLINNSRGPLQYSVDRLNVVVGTTTLPHKNYTSSGGVLPLGGRRTFRDQAIPITQVQSLLGSSHAGMLEMDISYGRAGADMTRRYKLVLDLTVHLGASVGIADLTRCEIDEEII